MFLADINPVCCMLSAMITEKRSSVASGLEVLDNTKTFCSMIVIFRQALPNHFI